MRAWLHQCLTHVWFCEPGVGLSSPPSFRRTYSNYPNDGLDGDASYGSSELIPNQNQCLFPSLKSKQDLAVFLDADPDVLLSRKKKVSGVALERSRTLYLALCQTNNQYHAIDAGQPREDVVESVLVQVRNLH